MHLAKIEDLEYRKSSKIILSNINWQIKPGECWIVMGNNGCGKTTLVSILAGYREWSSGTIKLFGEELSKSNTVDLRKRIAFVSSSYFDKCVRYENGLDIVLGAVNGLVAGGLDIAEEDVCRAKKILASLGMKTKGLYPYDLLSKGQRQKVLLARAFMQTPWLMILDEPCSGLDMLSRDFILNTLADIAENSPAAIVYVTHHADEIMPFFTHALLLKNGKIHSQGNIKDIISTENMSDFYDMPTEVLQSDGIIRFKAHDKLHMNQKLYMGG